MNSAKETGLPHAGCVTAPAGHYPVLSYTWAAAWTGYSVQVWQKVKQNMATCLNHTFSKTHMWKLACPAGTDTGMGASQWVIGRDPISCYLL